MLNLIFNYIYNNEKNGNFDDNLIEKMSDIAPYEDWNFNKTIVDINQIE